MTSALRWRIMTLQVVLLLVFSFGSGLLVYESNYISGTIHDQLASQQIYFPKTTDASFKALPASDRQAMSHYAGQQLTTGAQAQVYADNFIAVHLTKIAGGKTYAQVSEEAQAHPTNATLQSQRATLFQGEMLRGTLLNAYGWAQFGQYLFLAGIGAAVATLVVLGTLIFEFVLAVSRQPVVKSPKQAPSPA